jgi:hypothetical protein
MQSVLSNVREAVVALSKAATAAKAAAKARLWKSIFVTAAIALPVSISVGFLYAVATHDPEGVFGSNSAAWVQAIGSIAAVLGAAAIAGWQAHDQRIAARRQERKVRVDRVLSMGAVAIHVAQRLGKMKSDLGTSRANPMILLKAYLGELKIARDRMSGLFDIGLGSSVVETWIAAEAQIASLEVALEIATEAGLQGRATSAQVGVVLDELSKTVSTMVALGTACHGPMLATAIQLEAP